MLRPGADAPAANEWRPLDIGEETVWPVDDSCTPPLTFNGTIEQVTVDLK